MSHSTAEAGELSPRDPVEGRGHRQGGTVGGKDGQPTEVGSCPSRIRCQAATGSWTKSRQWETQRTLFNSTRATVWPPAKVNGV